MKLKVEPHENALIFQSSALHGPNTDVNGSKLSETQVGQMFMLDPKWALNAEKS